MNFICKKTHLTYIKRWTVQLGPKMCVEALKGSLGGKGVTYSNLNFDEQTLNFFQRLNEISTVTQ